MQRVTINQTAETGTGRRPVPFSEDQQALDAECAVPYFVSCFRAVMRRMCESIGNMRICEIGLRRLTTLSLPSNHPKTT